MSTEVFSLQTRSYYRNLTCTGFQYIICMIDLPLRPTYDTVIGVFMLLAFGHGNRLL